MNFSQQAIDELRTTSRGLLIARRLALDGEPVNDAALFRSHVECVAFARGQFASALDASTLRAARRLGIYLLPIVALSPNFAATGHQPAPVAPYNEWLASRLPDDDPFSPVGRLPGFVQFETQSVALALEGLADVIRSSQT
jgi:hypothetical protein